MSSLLLSTPKAIAGKESVIKLTHNIWTGTSGIGRFNNIPNNIANTSAKLLDNKNNVVFFMFAYIPRPSLTAFAMEE